jgi:hypothetical protein
MAVSVITLVTYYDILSVFFFLTFDHQPLSSAYGLAKHRDGRWEWAIAPGVSPSPRYQHAAVCCQLIWHFIFTCLQNFGIDLSCISVMQSPFCRLRFLSMHVFMSQEGLLGVVAW